MKVSFSPAQGEIGLFQKTFETLVKYEVEIIEVKVVNSADSQGIEVYTVDKANVCYIFVNLACIIHSGLEEHAAGNGGVSFCVNVTHLSRALASCALQSNITFEYNSDANKLYLRKRIEDRSSFDHDAELDIMDKNDALTPEVPKIQHDFSLEFELKELKYMIKTCENANGKAITFRLTRGPLEQLIINKLRIITNGDVKYNFKYNKLYLDVASARSMVVQGDIGGTELGQLSNAAGNIDLSEDGPDFTSEPEIVFEQTFHTKYLLPFVSFFDSDIIQMDFSITHPARIQYQIKDDSLFAVFIAPKFSPSDEMMN